MIFFRALVTHLPAEERCHVTLVEGRDTGEVFLGYYKALKKKGLEVISVSLDNDKKKWLEAVKQDKISWVQLADLNGFKDSKVKDAYKVKFVPTVYLIGADGMIKAKNPKLEELLK